MRIAVAASPAIAVPTLEALLNHSHEISIVITQPDAPSGRGRDLTQTDVATWAEGKGLPLFKAHSDQEVRDAVQDSDLLIAIGYGRILSEETISTPRFGSINLHFSMLPAYRGAAPAQRSLLAGDLITGVTVFALDKGLDTGPIYTQVECEIDPRWTGYQLLESLSLKGPSAVLAALEMIEQGRTPHPQKDVGISLAPKISKEETIINWMGSAQFISLQVRAFSPSVSTTFRGENFKIALAFPSENSMQLSPGEIYFKESIVLVGAEGGNLLVEEVIPSGKKQMSASAWANGARLVAGEHFE